MQVTVLSTGGTIASTAAEEGASPTKTGAELVSAVPELEDHASIDVEEVAHVPSFELDGATLESMSQRVAALDADEGVDAIVVTHGTDTMEETAYYLDAALHPTTPVFLTGAQRRPDEPGSDGPANLLTAVRAAEAFADGDATGCFIAFNEEIHAAGPVTKTHTSKLETFRSPSSGPVATVDRTGVRIHRTPTSETTHVPTTDLSATVHVVKSGSGVSGSLLEAALDVGADGLVVEGTGLGNVTAGLGTAIERAVEHVPVVVASRCLAGRTAPVYGSVGGGERLREYGATFAGGLPAHKARIKLTLGLSATETGDELRRLFAD